MFIVIAPHFSTNKVLYVQYFIQVKVKVSL